LGQTNRLHAIPQPRGSVTVMYGYAADVLKHCIRPYDCEESASESASLILRALMPQAKADCKKAHR